MLVNKKSLLTIILVKLLCVTVFVPTNKGCCHKIKKKSHLIIENKDHVYLDLCPT